jgi:lysophospholipase L1-like esterase
LSVVNMGISGNRVRRDGAGLSALARFDRDVLGRPGVRWIILLEGINDINISAIPGVPESEHATAAQIIEAYRQFIDRAHLHGIKVMGATIMPTEGLWLYSKETEAMRTTLNQWIRTSGKFDAVVDFDAATRDPGQPTRLKPEFDPGDHIHPNDAGNAAMANAIDLSVFAK